MEPGTELQTTGIEQWAIVMRARQHEFEVITKWIARHAGSDLEATRKAYERLAQVSLSIASLYELKRQKLISQGTYNHAKEAN